MQRNAWVVTFNLYDSPKISLYTLFVWTFGFHLLRVFRFEKLTLFPKITSLPPYKPRLARPIFARAAPRMAFPIERALMLNNSEFHKNFKKVYASTYSYLYGHVLHFQHLHLKKRTAVRVHVVHVKRFDQR